MIGALLAIALSAEPSLLRLGTDARATLRIESEATPLLSASVGHIEGLHPVGEGVFEAGYLPPDDAVPQVALIACISGAETGWIALPLWGQGDAVVKTRRRATITVEIGAQTFGPATADEHGEAIVPVVVPPGVDQAHHGAHAIDLHVPRTRTVHVALPVTAVPVDRGQEVPVFVISANPDGTPRSAPPLLRASRGELGPLTERSPGLYQASLRLAAGAPGEARVEAWQDDAPALIASAALELRAGAAASVTLEADRERIVAGEDGATLRALARDAAGNASDDELRFETTLGELHVSRTGPGEWSVRLAVPPSFQGRSAVEVRAAGAQASSSRVIALVPGEPSSAAFDEPLVAVRADGTSAVRLHLDVRDRYGNPVPGANAQVSAGQGRAQLEARGGALYARYVPPLLRERGNATVSARAGDAVARAAVVLLPQLQAGAVSPKAGVLSNLSGFTTPLLGAEAALRTDALGPQLAFSLEADYAYWSHVEPLRAGLADVVGRSRVDLMLVQAAAAWRFAAGEHNTAWVAAGPSLATYWSQVSVDGAPARRGFAVAPGLQAALGIERRMGLAVPFLEARAGWTASPRLVTLSGPLRWISLVAGARLEML